jgi:GrpB-like predicted nucleotidyltransferase (UPF0157 family)
VRITLHDHDPQWPHRFAAYGAELRRSLLDRVPQRLVAIHHIGSTSVPGLAAKNVIDIQVTVSTERGGSPFEPFEPLREAIEVHGYRWVPDCWDHRKRLFTLDHGERRLVNLHVRADGEFSAQAALLFRDLLRASAEARERYEATKRRLAEQDWPTVDDYAMAKGDTVWELLREADGWAAATGWVPDPSDA